MPEAVTLNGKNAIILDFLEEKLLVFVVPRTSGH